MLRAASPTGTVRGGCGRPLLWLFCRATSTTICDDRWIEMDRERIKKWMMRTGSLFGAEEQEDEEARAAKGKKKESERF